MKRLDVRWLCREGYLNGRPRWVTWHRGERETGSVCMGMEDGRLVVEYGYRLQGTPDWEEVRQVIELDWTSCHYGGQRPWFLCAGCHRRVAMLYGAGKRFVCRHCCGVPYASQCETEQDRRFRKVRKIRDRLGTSHNLLQRVGEKPKGMHWRTFQWLCVQERAAHWAVVEAMGATLDRLMRRG